MRREDPQFAETIWRGESAFPFVERVRNCWRRASVRTCGQRRPPKPHVFESSSSLFTVKTLQAWHRINFRLQHTVFYWDDNNRFKPRTTVTTLVTRGAVLYIGGRRSAY